MKIKEFREAKGYTQEEIASKLGMAQAFYSMKEGGKRPFKVEELLMLEILLGTTINEMFADKVKEIERTLKKE